MGIKMTKAECTGGPAGSQVLAWEKSSSEGGQARCYAFHKNIISFRTTWVCWDMVELFNMFSDDAKLLQFLRGCKFSLERTKEKLDLYNSCRSKLTQVRKMCFVHSGPAFLTGLSHGTHHHQSSKRLSTSGKTKAILRYFMSDSR